MAIASTTDRAFSERPLEEPRTDRFTRACLALTAFGVATDVSIAVHLGSSGKATLISSVLLGAPSAAGAVWLLLRVGRVRSMPSSLLVLAAFVAWSAASLFWSGDTESFVVSAVTKGQLLAWAWLNWQLLRSDQDLRATLAGYLVGCVALVALAWRNYLAGLYAVWDRYAADGFDPNDMAVYVALGIPIAAHLALSGGRARRWFLWYLPVAFSALSLSGSRGGLIAAAVATAGVLLVLARRTAWGFTFALALLGAGIAFAVWAVPLDTWSRFLSVDFGTAGDRTTIWRAGLAVLSDHPFVGVGAGGFERAVEPLLQGRYAAHSTPLSIAVEFGAVGAALFFGALALAMREAGRAGPDARALAWSLALTWFVGTVSLTWGDRKTTWFVFLLVASLGALRGRKRLDAAHAVAPRRRRAVA